MRTKSSSPRQWRSSFQFSIERLESRSLLAVYALTDLGTLGGLRAEANDINDAGHVVGQSVNSALKDRAFLWRDGVMTDLGAIAGSTSKGIGLNNAGQVVGYAAASGTNHAFLWEDGVMTDLVPGPQWSSGNAVNDAGQVVGAYNLNHPFIWEDGVLTDLGGFNGGASFGYALDINNAGQVVGSSYSGVITDGLAQHAFLWEDGVMTNLGVLPGMEDSRAHGINDIGQVVGFSSLFDPETTGEVSRSFLYSGGAMTDLNVPGESSAAEDINDAGQIVGWMAVGNGRAYLYDDGVVTDLNTLVPAGSGLTLTAARGINNAGQIVGVAVDAASRSHAFLLTPIAPDTPLVNVGDVSVSEGHSGTRIASFTVTLSAASTQEVTVNYATAGGTASAGSDYQSVAGTLTFSPGQTSRTVSVVVNGDRVGEPNETFFLNLSQAAGAVIADGQGAGAIIDDEPRLSVNDVALTESHSGTKLFVFTITLSSAYDVPVTVNFATADGTAKAGEDYTVRSGAITFAPGQTSTTISIAVKGDRKREASETFFFNLSNAVGALLLDGQGKGTILDDDRWF
jgi:probable HAF family extracellular repeat protein